MEARTQESDLVDASSCRTRLKTVPVWNPYGTHGEPRVKTVSVRHRENGVADGIRTRDLQGHNLAL